MLREFWSQIRIQDVSDLTCDSYFEWRTKPVNLKQGEGRRTTDRELNTLNNVFKYAKRRGVIRVNSLADRPRYQKSTSVRHCREFCPQSADELHEAAALLFQHPHSVVLGFQMLISLVCFNRLLLEDAYPQAIAKRKSQRPKQKTVRVGIGLFRIVGVQGIYGKKKIQGKTYVTALQTDAPKEAREKYEEWGLRLRKSLKMICAEKGTLASFVEPYLACRAPEVTRNKLKPGTIVCLRRHFHDLGQHWKEFHTLPISDLFPETITDLQNYLLTKARNRRTGKPLKLGTYNTSPPTRR